MWKDNFKIDLREIGMGVKYLIHLAQGEYQWRAHVINLPVP
jgi:hypothetical protein